MESRLKDYITEAIESLYNCRISHDIIQIQETRKEFAGDFTLVIFPLIRFSGGKPESTGTAIGRYLVDKYDDISSFNVINGFLNLVLSGDFWMESFVRMLDRDDYQISEVNDDSPLILVEYSSPNTNKPLHLGHIRNNLLGFSLYRILSACGNKVIKTNIVNDRGIHICKSMVAWLRHADGESPESAGMKGDHLVGKYYVMFEQDYRRELQVLIDGGEDPEYAGEKTASMSEARKLLRDWEAGDTKTVDLWRRMNAWVYEGFDVTYKRLGVDFDKVYYESDTYLRGKDIVNEALSNKMLYSREDGSVWVDLSDVGLGQKLLLRADGTAVYMTQDLGTAVIRHEDYGFDQTIYVVGNEQNYHFQVLAATLKKIGYPWAAGLHHFSYGMVELPEGRMKSREGTVVDADDIIDEMIETSRNMSEELGKLDGFSVAEREGIFSKVGLAALKYFMLKVDPKKNMTFNPAESIDFNGNTGPFIQYTYARISSVMKKAGVSGLPAGNAIEPGLQPLEKEAGLIRILRRYPAIVAEAAAQYNPSVIANFVYDLAREYNQFYHDYSILNEPDSARRDFRILLSGKVADTIKAAMWMLGIEMPERM